MRAQASARGRRHEPYRRHRFVDQRRHRLRLRERRARVDRRDRGAHGWNEAVAQDRNLRQPGRRRRLTGRRLRFRRRVGVDVIAAHDDARAQQPEEVRGDAGNADLLGLAAPFGNRRASGTERGARSSNVALDWSCRSRKSGGENVQSLTFRARSSPHTMTRRDASAYGSGRSRTAFTTLKIAVQAPMPSAIVIVATVAKPRFSSSPLTAWATSLSSMSMEREAFQASVCDAGCSVPGHPAVTI